jgi:ubiquinone/menaquinone biosynthesis C-methylase UbiE
VPDIYANIAQADRELLGRICELMEVRAADPRQRAMLQAYLSEIELPPGASVLEIGCGTGAVARTLARWPGVAQVLGCDPSDVFLTRARELAAGVPNLSFCRGDGRQLELPAASLDVVVLHTTLCHVPEPERVLAEAARVLRGDGWLAVFDGDYASATVAQAVGDPLERCVDAFRASFVHDPWIVRRLPRLLEAAGFSAQQLRSHGYVEGPEAGYMMSWIERGADVLVRSGQIGAELASALKAEAQRRSRERQWFAHISFGSILGRKPRVAS